MHKVAISRKRGKVFQEVRWPSLYTLAMPMHGGGRRWHRRIGIHQCAARPLQRYGGCEWQLGAGYACGEDRPGNRDCDPGERAVAEVAYRNAHTLCFASSIQFSSRVALAMLPCSSQLSWDLRVYDTISRWS